MRLSYILRTRYDFAFTHSCPFLPSLQCDFVSATSLTYSRSFFLYDFPPIYRNEYGELLVKL